MAEDAGASGRNLRRSAAGVGRALLPLVALFACAGCESTALSLRDPNPINTTLDPEFLQQSETTRQVLFTATGMVDSGLPVPPTWIVVDYEFGPGIYLSGYRFVSDYAVEVDLARSADATPGLRSMTLKIINSFGTYVMHGQFTVL